MKRMFFIVLILFLISFVFGISSESYNSSNIVIGSGEVNLSSDSYSTGVAVLEGSDVGMSSDSYQQGVGFYAGGDSTSPAVTLVSPSDAVSTTTVSHNFTFNVSDNVDVASCSLTIDDVVVSTLDSVINNVVNGIYVSSLGVASHTWSVSCSDSSRNVGLSSQYTLRITSPAVVKEDSGDAGGGGGGGGGGPAISKTLIEDIYVDIKDLSIDIALNRTKERLVGVSNNGDVRESVSISQENLSGMVSFDESQFYLAPGESRDLKILFIAPEKTGIYTGRIFISGNEILTSINVRTEPLLFDAMIVVPSSHKKISPGENLESQVTLIPMGDNPRLDVTLNYVVKSFDGKVYLSESETILVDSQKNFKKQFYTSNLLVGDYIIGLELIYPNGVATSSSSFEIKEDLIPIKGISFILLLVGILIVFVLIIVFIIRYKKHRHAIRRR